MATAQQRGWGNPDDKDYPSHLTVISVAGIKLRVHKAVAPLFTAFIKELTKDGYSLTGVADDWGYANRDVRGAPGVKSNHAWGLAIDLNSAANPMTSDGRNHTNMPPGVSALAAKFHLRWGGDYTGSRRDPMHFEYMGTPADAVKHVAALKSVPKKKRVQTNPHRKPAKTKIIKSGDTGAGVGWVQYQLGIKDDCDYGPKTLEAVKKFQAKHGLKTDGIVGPKSLTQLALL